MLRKIISRAGNLVTHGYYIPTDYYILDDKHLVYISIPKVACTSIKLALMGNTFGKSVQVDRMSIHHLSRQYLHHRLSGQQKGYYRFAFVRNPFDRLISCYEDKVRRNRQHSGRYHFDTNYNKILIRQFFGGSFHPEMTFTKFVELVAKIPDFLSDNHFRSQYSMLYRKDVKLVDYIGKFEDLQHDWNILSEKFGLLPLDIANPSARHTISDYYQSKQLVELVARRYWKDIELFDYRDNYRVLLESV